MRMMEGREHGSAILMAVAYHEDQGREKCALMGLKRLFLGI